MKKINHLTGFLIGLTVLFMAIPSFPKDVPLQSQWQSTPLKLDGKTEEWSGDTMAAEKGVKVDYAFRNDGRNLYVLFIFNDPKFLSSIEATGITLYFSPEGKKQKDFGVRFSKKNVGPDQVIAAYEKQGIVLTEDKKKEIRANKSYIQFEADAVDKKGQVIEPQGPQADVDVPTFRMARQGQLVVYEFRIPLAGRDFHPAGIGATPGQTLKVGFEWGGMTDEMKKAMASNIGGQEARARASDTSLDDAIRDGNEREAMGGGNSALTRMRMGPKKYSFWADVTLAQAQTQ